MKKVVAILASVLAVASVLVGFQLTAPAGQEPASALSGSSFQAGNIISDTNFYAGTSMSVDGVQSFLNTQIGSCASSSCLNVGRFGMNSRSADPMCNALTGGSSLSAAVIITRVAAACGISPKVILVTLQKEQTLINGATARNPSAARLERAMGYACPDNVGGHCDPAYAGVGNQIYWSAWQWKRYGNPPGTSNYFTWFNPGNRAVQYNVPVSCGTKTVAVQNRATAALYYYTPYTPNTAALNNLYGTGDGCSAYGNRNFWRLYTDWFGSTTGVSTSAKGTLDGIATSYNAITVNGWALDTTTNKSTRVDVYVGSKGTAVQADQNRPDIAAAYPKLGAKHGFNQRIPAAAGSQKVCAYAISIDGKTNQELGCQTVSVPDGSPFGSLDSARAVPGGVAVTGWAIDPESSGRIGAHITVDGTIVKKMWAEAPRADVGRAYPSAGPDHGYTATVTAPGGSHRICVLGINVKNGGNANVGSCKTVDVPGSTPTGALDSVTATTSTISVSGWAVDGDSVDPITVTVSIDGKGRTFTTKSGRGDIAKRYPAYGSLRGFEGTWTVGNGKHTVCVTANNVGAGGNASLGCKAVTVTNKAPIGSLDVAQAVSGGVQVSGWAIDPDTSASIGVDVYVDGVGKRVIANRTRSDVARSYPAAGPAHGYDVRLGARAGSHEVCVYGIDSVGGSNTAFGCRTVTVR